MELRKSFGQALKLARRAKGLAQEDSPHQAAALTSVAWRGYKRFCADRSKDLSAELEMHLLTLQAAAYLCRIPDLGLDELMATVKNETLVIVGCCKQP